MQLSLKKIEMATLILHMSIMRKNIKKGFKSNYGKQEGKEVLKAYDEVKEHLIEEIEGIEDDHFIKSIEFSTLDINMLSSFLNWYLLELELEIEGNNINEDDKQQIVILTEVKDKVNGLKINE